MAISTSATSSKSAVPTSNSSCSTSSSSQPSSSSSSHSLQWKEAVAGAVAAGISRSVMAPVERVKLILQLEHKLKEGETSRRSALRVAHDVYTKEGWMSFWRGNWPSVLRVGGTAAVNFTCLDYYKEAIVKPWLNANYYIFSNSKNASSFSADAPLWWSSLLAGGMAGATSTTLLYPLEFARTRLALDHGRVFRNMRHCVTEIVTKDGITGLYQGYGVALVGGIYYRVLYLGGFDAIKAELLLLQQQKEQQQKDSLPLSTTPQLTWFQRISMAQSISLVAGTLSYPMDSIRRRMMMQAGVPRQERQYRNGWHCAVSMYRTEGIRGFFLGLGPNIVRSIGGALLLVAYDTLRPMLGAAR